MVSRREFLKTASLVAPSAAAHVAQAAPSHGQTVTPEQIVELFEQLPGNKAFRILAAPKGGGQKFQSHLNSERMLFVASAIKTFALCESLRQADSPDVIDTLQKTELALDSSIWSL